MARKLRLVEYLSEEREKADINKVKELIKSGVNLDVEDEDGWTALMYASICGHTKVVDFLIELCVYPDTQDGDGYTALMYAIEYGQIKVAKTLIENGCNFEITNNVFGSNALMLASKNGQSYIVQMLLDNKADVSVKDIFKQTALKYAEKEQDKCRDKKEKNEYKKIIEMLTNDGLNKSLSKFDPDTLSI